MWKKLASAGELTPGKPLAVEIDGLAILVVETGAGLFALEDSCPHQKQPLSSGTVKGDKLTCRHHGIEIDMNTGKVVWAMGLLNLDDAKSFPVKKESGAVWVDC